MTANNGGIAVTSHPQKNDRIAKTRLQIAIGAVRDAGAKADGGSGGGVS